MAEKKKPCKKKSADDVSRELILKAMGADADKMYAADQRESVSEVFSTGLSSLDKIMTPMLFKSNGKGGLPGSFVAEFFGPHAGGKSSLAHKICASITKANGWVVYIDAEHSYVKEWAEVQGVVSKRVMLMPAGQHGEFYLRKACVLAKAAKESNLKLIVIDSVTALIPHQVMFPKKAIDDSKDSRVGARAKMLSEWLPQLTAAASEGGCAVILINQIRDKLNVMYGNPETTPGGHALEFAASLRLRLQKVGKSDDRHITKDDESIGIKSVVKIIKNRFGPAEQETIMPIYYTDVRPGPLDQILDAAMEESIVKSRSKKDDEGETYQTFTFKPAESDKIAVDGMEPFKQALSTDDIFEIYELLKVAGRDFDDDVKEYVASIKPKDDEDEEETAKAETADAIPSEDVPEPEVPVK